MEFLNSSIRIKSENRVTPPPQTIGVFGGTIYGVVYMVSQISEGVKSTKEKYVSRV